MLPIDSSMNAAVHGRGAQAANQLRLGPLPILKVTKHL